MGDSAESSKRRKGKFRSTRRKKRKGFHGKKAWEIRGETSGETASEDGASQHEISEEPQPSTSTAQSKRESLFSRKNPKNMSQLKLMNSSFLEFDRQSGVSTRSQTNSSGTRSDLAHEKACGFKLQDAELLSECISTSAICSLCRRPESKLQLFQENNNRNGLAESLYLKCSCCGTVTPLKTTGRNKSIFSILDKSRL